MSQRCPQLSRVWEKKAERASCIKSKSAPVLKSLHPNVATFYRYSCYSNNVYRDIAFDNSSHSISSYGLGFLSAALITEGNQCQPVFLVKFSVRGVRSVSIRKNESATPFPPHQRFPSICILTNTSRYSFIFISVSRPGRHICNLIPSLQQYRFTESFVIYSLNR